MASTLPHPRVPLVDERGLMSADWYRFFTGFQRDFDGSETVPGSGLTLDGNELAIADNGVGNDKLRDSLPLSVIGRALDSEGDPLDIIAAANGRFLQRDDDLLVFRYPRLPEFTLATAPSASEQGEGTIIYVSDESGGPAVEFSDGTSWNVITYLGGGAGIDWGAIGGTLSAQTDLQSALDLKANISSLGYFATGTDATNLTGTVAAARLPAMSGGDVTSSAGSAVLTIGSGAVSLAKMANVATATIFYRKTAGSGAPEVQTLATLKADLGLTGTNSGDQTITLTGDVTGSGTGAFATAIGANKVTYSQFQQVAASSLVGNPTGSLANAQGITLGATLTFSGTTLNAAKVPNALTFNTSGGAAAGATFDGSAVKTIDYSTVGAAALSHTHTMSQITDLPVVASGTYTPTLTNTTNVAASTAYVCQWMRVGNTVTVSGKFDIDPTTAAIQTEIRMTLPVTVNNFAAIEQACGTGAANNLATETYAFFGLVGGKLARVGGFPSSNANIGIFFSFTYQIV